MGCGSSRTAEEEKNSPEKNKSVESKGKAEKNQKANKHHDKKKKVKSRSRTATGDMGKNNQELIEDIYYGIVADNCPFYDCLITSEEEFERNLKSCIAKQIVEYIEEKPGVKPKVKYLPNDQDEILNDPHLKIDFSKFHVIAVRGAYIENVKLNNETYAVTVSEDYEVEDNEYCAVMIYIPEGLLPSTWEYTNPPPKNLVVEQRALNDNVVFIQPEN
jgi:hypothetical protein